MPGWTHTYALAGANNFGIRNQCLDNVEGMLK
jgi:hypothetical protein